MKTSAPIYLVLLTAALCFMYSCKQKNQNPYAYNLNKDTIRPVLKMTVPVDLDNYLYGEDIHMVGTATDLQSRDKNHQYAGKLKSLSMIVQSIDPVKDTVIKVLFAANPAVDGKSGIAINETTFLTSGPTTTYCRFKAYLTDYADHVDSSIVYFTVHY